MVAAADLNDPHEGRLSVTAVPGGDGLRDLMPAYQAHVASFAWRDANSIVWVADEGTGSRVGTVTLDGPQRSRTKADVVLAVGAPQTRTSVFGRPPPADAGGSPCSPALFGKSP